MLNLEKSYYADSIYYADLFRINNEIWMIMGYGKSDAARIASGKRSDDDIGRDCIAIRNNNGTLEGRYDPGAINPKAKDGLSDFYKIDHIVYCLSPEQTDEVFDSQDKVILNCPLETMMHLCIIYPYSAYAAQAVFSHDELAYLNDPARRSNKFYEIVSSCNFRNLGIAPYMNTVEEKAELYRQIANA
ncbi:MAG: hypothetical protein HUJ13_05335 [Hydrogenovibrio crunogenus]|nr:hypothetical protein [Hydrogenovibrio crunogenus]